MCPDCETNISYLKNVTLNAKTFTKSTSLIVVKQRFSSRGLQISFCKTAGRYDSSVFLTRLGEVLSLRTFWLFEYISRVHVAKMHFEYVIYVIYDCKVSALNVSTSSAEVLDEQLQAGVYTLKTRNHKR